MFKLKSGTRLLFLCIFSLLLLLLFLPFEIPYYLTFQSVVFPKAEWIVYKGEENGLHSSFINYLKDTPVDHFYQMKGQKDFTISFKENLSEEESILKNDTIAFITSAQSLEEINYAKSRILEFKTLLKADTSDIDKSVQKEYQKTYETSIRKYALQKRIYLRKKSLFAKNKISAEEYSEVFRLYESDSVDTEIDRLKYISLKTGLKNKDVKYILAQIKSYENKIKTINKNAGNLIVKSPITGAILNYFSTDTLLSAADLSMGVIKIPVESENRKHLNTGMNVLINDPLTGNSAEGRIKTFSREQKPGHNDFYYSASVIIPENKIPAGTLVECKIQIALYSPLKYLTVMVGNIFK